MNEIIPKIGMVFEHASWFTDGPEGRMPLLGKVSKLSDDYVYWRAGDGHGGFYNKWKTKRERFPEKVKRIIVAQRTVEVGPKMTRAQAKDLWDRASTAGVRALEACKPMPMVVGSPSTPLGNDIDPKQPTYFVEGGVCGFAWVTIFPARGSFVSYLKSKGIGSKGYRGGWEIWASVGGQSMQRKEAWARAIAEVLRESGLKAYAGSRMD